MIDYQYRKPIVICDCCGEGFRHNTIKRDTLYEAKREGWQLDTRDVSDSAEHYCPECREDT